MVFAVAALATLGGILDVAPLAGFVADHQSMSMPSAIGFLVIAAELVALIERPAWPGARVLTLLPGLVVGTLALGLIAGEAFTGRTAAIAAIPFGGQAWAAPPLLTAALFALTGAALTLLATHRRGATALAHALLIPIAVASQVVVVSDLLDVQTLHEIKAASIAMNTGLAFAAASLAMFALAPGTWLTRPFVDDPAGRFMARRLLPGLLLVPLIVGWARLYGERTALFTSEVGVVLVAATYGVVLVGFLWLAAKTVNRAHHDLRASAARFQLLTETAGELLRSAEPERAVRSLCHRVMTHLDCHVFMSFLVDEARGLFHLNEYAGISAEQARQVEWVDDRAAMCGVVARRGHGPVAQQLRVHPAARAEVATACGMRAHACHPLLGVGGKMLGTLSFGTRSRDTFSADDLSLMKAATDQVAAAVTRGATEQALRRLNSELEGRVVQQTTELNRTYQSVTAERRRLYDVLEILPVSVVLLTRDHHVPFANRTFRERFGEPHDRLCYDYLFGRTAPCETCESFKTLSTRAPHRWEWTGPDGRHYEVVDFPFSDSDGTTLVLEMGIDVTERRRAEADLRAANLAAEERSDQLRTLASELTLTEQRERQRLADLLHDGLQQLLVGAKFRLGALHRIKERRVRDTARAVSDLLTESIETSRSLTYELSPPVLAQSGLGPALHWLTTWMGDKHGLAVDLEIACAADTLDALGVDLAVLLFMGTRELLFNVVKHAGVQAARVRVSTDAGALCVAVTDGGQGFDPSLIRAAGGKAGGFGLFSLNERLRLLGGRMEIDSAPGRGSRFRLVAPATPAKDMPVSRAATAASHAATPSPESAAKSQKIRVMLVDDHEVMRQGLAELLAGENDLEIVGEAADGRAGIALLSKVRPDVVLMDVNMPGLSGVETTTIIHTERPDVRIIGLSMFEEDEMAAAMFAAGAEAYFVKSAPTTALVQAIRSGATHAPPALESKPRTRRSPCP
ncbi:MAG: response regulator [Deltaproteobacteria bacterium]|nr:response regulator [Deltaproteobacteria bacterium]